MSISSLKTGTVSPSSLLAGNAFYNPLFVDYLVVAGGGGGGMGGGMGGFNFQDLITPTDFWGKYILTKEN